MPRMCHVVAHAVWRTQGRRFFQLYIYMKVNGQSAYNVSKAQEYIHRERERERERDRERERTNGSETKIK